MATSIRNETLDVTNDDIKKGKRGSAAFCPIALAARRLFPDAVTVVVGTFDASITGGDYNCHATLPWRARRFIADFDGDSREFPFFWRRRAKPFAFDVEFKCRSLASAVVPVEEPTADNTDKGDPETGKTDAEIDAGNPGPDPDVQG